MGDGVKIRIWKGCKVLMLIDVDENGHAVQGPVGGAGNSARPDIEFDPWASLIVDHRVPYPSPVSIREEMDE